MLNKKNNTVFMSPQSVMCALSRFLFKVFVSDTK